MVETMKDYKQRIAAPIPKKLVENGKFNLGAYNEAIPQINFLDAHQPLGLPTPNWINNLRLREWQAFQIANKDHFFMAAIFNAKPMGLLHFVHYNIKTKEKKRFERKLPFNLLNVANGLLNSESRGEFLDFSFKVVNAIKNGEINIAIKSTISNLPEVDAYFHATHTKDKVTPIVTCQPFNSNAAMYSHKALMPVKGAVNIGGDIIRLEEKDSWLIIDDHKGFYPRRTQWDWVTGAINNNGERIGFNLTDNQTKHKDLYNENCLWVNDEMHFLPPVKFTRKKGNPSIWTIMDEFDRVNVCYYPEIETDLKENYLIARTDYHSCYGFFDGYIRNTKGEKVDVKQLFGAGEQFDITM